MLSSMPGQRKQMRLCRFKTLAIEEANLYDHQLRDCMRLDTAHTVASAVAPSLDKSLWQTRLCRKKVALLCCGVALCRLFESRLHILVHRADALPADVLGIAPLCPVRHIAAVAAQVPDASAKAVVRVAARPDDAAALPLHCAALRIYAWFMRARAERGSFSPAAMCCKSWLLSQKSMALQQSCGEEA